MQAGRAVRRFGLQNWLILVLFASGVVFYFVAMILVVNWSDQTTPPYITGPLSLGGAIFVLTAVALSVRQIMRRRKTATSKG